MASPIGMTVATPWRGMALAAAGYGLLSTQDAIVKFLVQDYQIPQILFMRSVVIVAGVLLMQRMRRLPSIGASANKQALFWRAAITLIAWFCYYTAAKRLPLPQLTTIYFAAPIICVLLSIVVLKERVGLAQWLAVLTGFTGVLVAVDPAATIDLLPACLVVVAAACWATAAVLIRKTSSSESTLNQILAGSLLFMAACAVMLPSAWVAPSASALCLMLSLGLIGGFGQYLLYEGFRFAPASFVAPSEYTMLIWATAYGFLFWHDWPSLNTLAGAALIACSSLWLIRRKPRAA